MGGRNTVKRRLAKAPSASQSHLVYCPHPGHQVEKVVERAVGLMLALPRWHISLRLLEVQTHQELECMVRSTLEKCKLNQPFLAAQTEALQRGLTVTKSMKAKAEEEPMEEQSQADTRGAKQVMPSQTKEGAARVLLNVPKAKTTVSSSSTRSPLATDVERAADAERATQEKALSRAKKQRERDLEKAAARGTPPKKPRGDFPKAPRKTAPKKDKGKAPAPVAESDEESD